MFLGTVAISPDLDKRWVDGKEGVERLVQFIAWMEVYLYNYLTEMQKWRARPNKASKAIFKRITMRKAIIAVYVHIDTQRT